MDGDVSTSAAAPADKVADGLRLMLEGVGCQNVKVRAVTSYDVERDVQVIRIELTADVR